MRPAHWLKNALVFIPTVFSVRLLELSTFGKAAGGFFVFSFLSSAVYILNDIRDADADRRHPVKKNRPVASGEIPVPAAWCLMSALAVAAVLLNLAVCGADWRSFTLMEAYFAINLGYSLGLKGVPFLDISLLVAGFMLRVYYGAAVINESVSHWVALTIIALSFYLSLGKRRNELLRNSGNSTRKVLRYYSLNFLDKFMYLCLAIAIVFYALWSADAAIIAKFRTDKLIWTVPLVIILMMKYSADIESDSEGDPVDVIVHDRVLLLLSFAYGIILLLTIYLPAV